MGAGGGARGGTLLVASTGGHLEELFRLKDRLTPAVDDAEWVTFDTSQSRSLLADATVHHVRYVAPRAYAAAIATLVDAHRILRAHRYDRVVSTGAGVAIPLLTAARMRGIPCHYIESAARSEGPSFTGSLVSRLPGVRLYTQYQRWASRRWNYRGSLFDQFEVGSTTSGSAPEANRVVVTLGTMETYGFRRALERLVKLLPEVLAPDAEVLWQVGVTDASGLGIEGRVSVPAHELRAAIDDADLVIAHSGVGSALTALEAGHSPVLLPRSHAHAEHVDDHQQLIGSELKSRGLAVCRDPDDLIADDLMQAMAATVSAAAAPAPFQLIE